VVGQIPGLTTISPLDGADEMTDHLRKDFGLEPRYATEVTDAFDHAALSTVVRTTQPVKLLRLFGGDAKALGRWYFCCIDGADASRAPNMMTSL
jgi:hypothetical protein